MKNINKKIKYYFIYSTKFLKKNFAYLQSQKFLWIVFGGLLVLIFLNSLWRYFDRDELEVIHTSWKILKGERIFQDFFQHHHPFFYYLLVPLVALCGESIITLITARIFVFLMFLGILFISYYLAAKIFNKKIALIALILLSSSPVFYTSTLEIRPDVPQTLAGLLALLFLFNHFKSRSRKKCKNLILSACFAGISFLFLQKAIYLAFILGALILWQVLRKNIPWRDCLIYFLVFVLTLAPYFLYLYFSHTISLYWTFNWVLNLKFLNHFSPWGTLKYIGKTNVILSLFSLIGLILLFSLHTKIQQKYLGLIALGLFLSFFTVRAPYAQYLMSAVPLFAIIAGWGLYALFKNSKGAIVFFLILSILFSAKDLGKIITKSDNKAQLEKINYVLSLTPPSDYVYDGEPEFNLFRKDIHYFWFSVGENRSLQTYQTFIDPNYSYDIYYLIDKMEPKIISRFAIENMGDGRVVGNYRQSDCYKDLYIRIKP